MDNKLYPIGTKTKIGVVKGIHKQHDNPERYYFIVDKQRCVSYMPQSSMEGLLS